MSSSAVTLIVSLGAAHWLVLESFWTKAKLRNGYKVYSAPWGLKVLYFLGVPTFIYGAIANALQKPDEQWVSAILLALAVGCVFSYPATILLSDKEIVSTRWFGMKRTTMRWQHVAAVYVDPQNKTINILDKDQRCIVYTVFNVDRAGFVSELTRRAMSSKDITLRL